MDPKEDLSEKNPPPRSSWVAIHDGKNMASEVTDGSYIGDQKFI